MSKENEIDTLVAFLDISGFKSYLNKGLGRKVINDFYTVGARLLRQYNRSDISKGAEINGILISDCAILYLSEEGGIDTNFWHNQLLSMLSLVREYNIKMLRKKYLLTCSIACGPCDYEPRMDDEYVRKNALIGQGYVRAFTDNEYGVPKLQPGECRIVTEGLPEYPRNIVTNIGEDWEINPEKVFLTDHSNLRKSKDGKHINYYWMLQDGHKIDEFTQEIQTATTKMYAGVRGIYSKYLKLNPKQT